jgi:DNA replication and repair protein RecF
VAARDQTDRPGGAAEHASKRLKLNGVARRASDVIGQIAAVMFTAADIDLITGPPAGRRRYLDIMISQTDPLYVRALQRYARILLQRNHLLRRIDEGQARAEELGFWDTELAREGARIMHIRRGTVQAAGVSAAEFHRRLSEGREELRIAYAPQTPLAEDEPLTVEAIESRLHAALARQRRREIATGATSVGPHRDDLRFELDGVPLGDFGSRAQQRTAALSLRLAEMAFLDAADKDPPLLLLDDILSELDDARRRAVLSLLHDVEQVFVTTAEPERFREAGLPLTAEFTVEAGRLSSCPAGG